GGGTPAAGVPVGGSPPRRSSDQNPTAPTPVQALPSANTKMLGKYRIHSQLGQGGMGAVYLAEDTHLNRKVALKVLPKELASNREFIKRFLAEARVTGKLSHPNIVVAYDIDSSQGLWFMAMEYLEGESIGARLKRGDPIPWRDALTMVKQVCKGLAYAHKSGIVHRDIKPDNLFLDKASGEAKILDMGLSKNLHASENSSLTQAGMILGTPNYLAPEQAENGINVDARADIYSLGTTLYHMLTGVPPFEGPTPLSIIQKHLFEPMPDVRKGRPDVPSDVANLLWKMTAKKPADRFGDCNELLAAIDDVLEGRGFQLADPMQGGRRTGSGGRNPAAGSGQRLAQRAGTRSVTPIDRKSRQMYARNNSTPVLFIVVGVMLVAAIGVLAWLAIKNNAQPPQVIAQNPPPGTSPEVTQPTQTAPIVQPTLPPTPAGPLTAPAPGPAVASATGDITAIVNSASRGLNLSDQVDRELVDRETQDNIRRLMQDSGQPRPPTVPSDPETLPATGAAGDASLSPRAGAQRLVHALTADEKKKAGTVLDGFNGTVVFRMAAPAVTDQEVLDANIASSNSSDLNNLRILRLGAPPNPISPEVYQGVFVEPDPRQKPQGKIDPAARIRLLMKVECSDRQPVEYRFMYSSLPVEGSTVLGGMMGRMPACEWQLIDMPLMVYRQHVDEKNWFGYASGAPEDFKNHRKITISVSDIIIYNPKP
ncbi:MAG TPA: protein kinase, partial [Planctomycetota bacterium]|nr:protein kinase [Planctomycetota bacterium]